MSDEEVVIPSEPDEHRGEDQADAAPAAVPPPADETTDTGSRQIGPSEKQTPEGSDNDRLMSMLAWLSMVILQLPIVSVILLVAESTRERTFPRRHAVTSLLFFAAAIVYEGLASVVFSILSAVTLGCGMLCLWPIFLVPHALGLYYALRAYNGYRVELPVLTEFAEKQGWI